MYSKFIRPLLFLLNPEQVHHLTIRLLRLLDAIPGMRWIIRQLFAYHGPSLEKEVLGMKFPNPIGLAAGFDKNAEIPDMLGAFGFGFVEVGAITPKPQPGNPKPRLFRLPKDRAIINRMGFNNRGMEYAIANLRRRKGNLIVGANIGKNSATPNECAGNDYLKLFRSLYEYVDYFVVNVSCPNVADITELQNKAYISQILEPFFEFRRGQNQYRPVLVKISPDLTWEQIDEIIDVLMNTPLDGLVATNTTSSRKGLTSSEKQVEAIGNGGLSGAPLTDRAIEVIRYLYEKTEGRYPIIGVGGIMTPEDALAMLRAGADLVQVYTGMIYEGPGFVRNICRTLEAEGGSQRPYHTFLHA